MGRLNASALAIVLTVTVLGVHAASQSFIALEHGRVHYDIRGNGQPWFVLVGGVGNPLNAWDSVFAKFAKLTTTVRMSRSGLGLSTFDGRDQRTFDDLVDELAEFVERVHVPQPFVLVGHSYGGLIVRAFAARRPNQVAGLLLVDSTFEDYYEVLEGIEPRVRELEAQSFQNWLRDKPPTSAAHLETDGLFALWKRSPRWPYPPSPDVPVVVLTSVKTVSDDPLRSTTGLMVARYDAQHRWVNKLSWSMHISTAQSGHFIQSDEPELLSQSASMLLSVVRTRTVKK